MKNKTGQSAVKIGGQIDLLLIKAKEKELKLAKDESLIEAIKIMGMNICTDKKYTKLKEVVTSYRLTVEHIEKKY